MVGIVGSGVGAGVGSSVGAGVGSSVGSLAETEESSPSAGNNESLGHEIHGLTVKVKNKKSTRSTKSTRSMKTCRQSTQAHKQATHGQSMPSHVFAFTGRAKWNTHESNRSS